MPDGRILVATAGAFVDLDDRGAAGLELESTLDHLAARHFHAERVGTGRKLEAPAAAGLGDPLAVDLDLGRLIDAEQ